MANLHSMPNPFYNSYWVNKFVNKFMINGRKIVVEKHIYNAFTSFKQQYKINPTPILLKSLCILKPIVYVTKLAKRQKKRKKTVLIPIPIYKNQQLKIALNWYVKFILDQKKERRLHNYKPINTYSKKIKGISKKSKSKKKIFYDRFQIALKNQKLNNLVFNQWVNLFKNSFENLVRKKLAFYITVTNARTKCRYRWA